MVKRLEAKLRYGLELLDGGLPAGSLAQGLDVVDVMRNVHLLATQRLRRMPLAAHFMLISWPFQVLLQPPPAVLHGGAAGREAPHHHRGAFERLREAARLRRDQHRGELQRGLPEEEARGLFQEPSKSTKRIRPKQVMAFEWLKWAVDVPRKGLYGIKSEWKSVQVVAEFLADESVKSRLLAEQQFMASRSSYDFARAMEPRNACLSCMEEAMKGP